MPMNTKDTLSEYLQKDNKTSKNTSIIKQRVKISKTSLENSIFCFIKNVFILYKKKWRKR